MAAESDAEHPLDVARDNDKEINQMLAETDGAISAMQYTGTIGYHVHVAEGETKPEYLWKIALLQALDETVFEMFYIGADDPDVARREMEQQLREQFDPVLAHLVANKFDDKLRALIETQEQFA